MYKVRPLMNLLNERFQQHGIFHRNLSVDESMVKYFGHHPCKQFMRGKPIRFGYKNWMMCNDDGYCYAFDTYCGKSAKTDNNPLGSCVVLSLLEATSNPSDHIVFFIIVLPVTVSLLHSVIKDLGLQVPFVRTGK